MIQFNEPNNFTDNSYKLVSKSNAAKMLGIGKERLNYLIAEGKIGIIHIEEKDYIPTRELNRFITDNIQRIQSDESQVFEDEYDFNDLMNGNNNARKHSGYDSTMILEQIMKGDQ